MDKHQLLFYVVTPDGQLNVQTLRIFDDFLFQVNCMIERILVLYMSCNIRYRNSVHK
jgi:hypothetical protein